MFPNKDVNVRPIHESMRVGLFAAGIGPVQVRSVLYRRIQSTNIERAERIAKRRLHLPILPWLASPRYCYFSSKLVVI
jgi:hypothetical protein